MAERQAKKNRKNDASNQHVHVEKNKSNILFNTIVIVLIAAVFALGAYAVGLKYVANHPKDAQQTEQQTTTVADYIKDKGMTLDEFKAEYGLSDDEEVKEDTNAEAAAAKMTLENYAKYSDMSLEDLKKKYSLADDVDNSTKWQDAISFMPTGVVSKNFFGMDFDSFKQQANFPDTITADTPWSETNNVMSEQYAAQQAENANNSDNAENADSSSNGNE